MSTVLFDIGNTRLKWGVLTASGEVAGAGYRTHKECESDNYAAVLDTLPGDIDRVVAANVAGRRVAADLSRAIDEKAGIDIDFATSRAEACGLTNGYDEPARLGVDRWAACVGAWTRYPDEALLVVDAGTATTLDAIDSSGQHLGGLILPGLTLMGRVLDTATSGIGTDGAGADDPEPENLFGRTTDQAVRSGALAAICGAMERACRVLEGIDQVPRILLTGGDARRIQRQWHYTVENRPDLVLEGLAALAGAE
jgi:type III pantothenate kinase